MTPGNRDEPRWCERLTGIRGPIFFMLLLQAGLPWLLVVIGP